VDLSTKIISDDHLIKVCKYRQPGCCKYIVFFSKLDDFYCVKNVEELRNRINQNEMKATGDNCKGL
jgi:hypothetical protein